MAELIDRGFWHKLWSGEKVNILDGEPEEIEEPEYIIEEEE